MDCIFCKIVKGEIPSHKVWENHNFVAFLDAFPSVKGQTLVVPKRHIEDYVFDMDDWEYEEFTAAAKRVVNLLDNALNPIRTCLLIEGFDVPHVHIKLYPVEGPGFSTSLGPRASDEELASIAEKIRGD